MFDGDTQDLGSLTGQVGTDRREMFSLKSVRQQTAASVPFQTKVTLTAINNNLAFSSTQRMTDDSIRGEDSGRARRASFHPFSKSQHKIITCSVHGWLGNGNEPFRQLLQFSRSNVTLG